MVNAKRIESGDTEEVLEPLAERSPAAQCTVVPFVRHRKVPMFELGRPFAPALAPELHRTDRQFP
jgi:hypothetical protein